MKLKNKNNPIWINDYSKAVKSFTFNHDPSSHLPFNAFDFYPLYFDVWLDKIYDTILKIRSLNKTNMQIDKSMPSYGALRFITYTFINMAVFYNYNHKKIKVILDFFTDSMKRISNDSNIYNEYMILLKNNKSLFSEIKNLKKIEDDKEIKMINNLSGVLAMYNHALFNDYSTEYGYNIEGPYKYVRGKVLIKNYPDLSPTNLWTELEECSIKNIKIIQLYKNISIKMRFVSTHIIAKNNYQSSTDAYAIYFDNKRITNIEKIKNITEEIANLTVKIYLKQKNMSFNEIKIKFMEQQGYELKDFFDLAGVDWKPSDKLINRVKNKNLYKVKYNKNWPENKKEYEDYVGVTYLKNVYGYKN